MVFLKKIEVRCQKDRFGSTQRGLFALESIKKGEPVWFCDCGDKDGTFTRAQLLALIEQHPHLDYFVRSFSYMVDDDLYALPHTYLEQKNNDECALFNHSCDPTCGFTEDGFGDNVVAIRDIAFGEELTYHYGILETESSLIYGMKCKCMSSSCVGRLTFDYYRDPDFVSKYFQYMTPYLKQKVLDMKSRWYSSNCYVKRFPVTRCRRRSSSPPTSQPSLSSSTSSSNNSSSSEDIETATSVDTPSLMHVPPATNELDDVTLYEKGLTSLTSIKKGELIAKFSHANMIDPGTHFIRNSSQPNCILLDGNVYTNEDIAADTELTLDFSALIPS